MEQKSNEGAIKMKPSVDNLDACNNVNEFGFAIVPDVMSKEVVDRFCGLVDAARASENTENVSNGSGTYGLRNLTDVIPETAELAKEASIVRLVESVIGTGAFMVRATLFDKTPGANWGVFWHQDLSIAVEKRHEVSGYAAWTRKAGVQCVQPPIDVMEEVLAVRLHLDDCSSQNGALKVLAGSHRMKKLTTAAVESTQQETAEHICEVGVGGAVLMRPLLLHASSPMETESSRRVIHLEFANFELPGPLQWKYRIR